MAKIPSVVIVGRTNVGKSTLFNRLSVDAKSITLDLEGVTRDFIKDTVCWQDRCFELIDTGGISFRKTKDIILETVRKQAQQLIDNATLILFVLDGKVGLLPEDKELARMLHKSGKSVIVVINKIDNTASQEHMHEFERLGFEATKPVSAQHSTGIGDLLEAIVQSIPAVRPDESQEQERICKVVLLGKPNVGKSSLMNLLLNQERSIVSEQPGTTREAITEKIAFNKADLEVTDTAGIRRKRGVTEKLETLMVKSSFKAVEEADIVLLLVDASEGRLADQELKLAFYIFEHYKGLILLLNKQDLVQEYAREDMGRSLEEYQHLLKKIVKLEISCKSGKNVGKILPLIEKVWERYNIQLDTQELTRLFKDALYHKPLYHQSHLLVVHHVRQVSSAPLSLMLIVNEPKWFESSQLGFFENILRAKYDLLGTPIKFIVRKEA